MVTPAIMVERIPGNKILSNVFAHDHVAITLGAPIVACRKAAVPCHPLVITVSSIRATGWA